MAKTFIGIDIDGKLLRAVALEEAGNGLKPVAIVQRDLIGDDDAAETISLILRDWDSSNVRLAMALQVGSILTRRLSFPFGDYKKIAAAVPLELGVQLPIDLNDHFITSLPAVASGETFKTIGLALPPDLIESTLTPFDERQLPLRDLGIAPFAYVGQLQDQPEDSLLISVCEQEISTLLIQGNEPINYRTISRDATLSATDIMLQLERDVMSLQKSAGLENLPVIMIGSGLDPDLEKIIIEALPVAKVPDETFEGEKLPASFLPALALARLAAAQGRKSFNLRQGKYSYRGSLAPFKKQLIAAAVLITLTLTSLIGGSWMSYARKATSVDKIQKQLESIFMQTFPQVTDVPKDVPLHMTSRLNEARRQSQLFGGPGSAPLPSLEVVSRAMPTGADTVIEELTYDKDGIRLAGQTTSFDAVDQLAAGLKKELIFSDARISDAKMSIDGKQVKFRIELKFAGQGGAS